MKFSMAEFLCNFVEPHGQQAEAGESYHYVDHANDIGLLAYSKDTYVFASIPLGDLLKQVTPSQAWAVMNSVWKSGPVTGKRPEPDRTRTDQDRK